MEAFAPEGQEPKAPERGISLVRTGDEATFLRHRLERPARFGRYVLAVLGAIAAAAGVALWISTGSALGLALGLFGGVLIVLGVVQHLLLRRDLNHWPTDALLWDDGLELVLYNGEVRGASWTDPDIGLHLVARRAPAPAQREYLLVWLMESSIPPVELSAEGFDRVTRAAVDRGLKISQTRKGSRKDAPQLIDIRQGAAAAAAALAKSVETTPHS